MNEKTLSNLASDEIEEIEKLTLRWIFQAVLDFGMEAHEIFLKSPDNVKDMKLPRSAKENGSHRRYRIPNRKSYLSR